MAEEAPFGATIDRLLDGRRAMYAAREHFCQGTLIQAGFEQGAEASDETQGRVRAQDMLDG